MKCPHCNFKFKVLSVNATSMPQMVPILCEHCGDVSLYFNGTVRKMTEQEITEVKKSPAFKNFIQPMQHQLAARYN